MHVLLITQEPPFDAGQVATGNAIRSRQLKQALTEGGHSVQQAWLDTADQRNGHTFKNHDQLRSLIASAKPEVILVSYWELLSLLPHDLQPPVVLDFVAPRPLEQLFEAPETLASDMRRLRINLAKCDLLLTGNEDQAGLLTLWLLEAGFDLREATPVRTVPLAARPLQMKELQPDIDGWMLVSGGVNWPWRASEAFDQAVDTIAASHPGKLGLARFGGHYRWHETNASPPDATQQQLATYQDWSAFLSDSAHLGLELGADNIERRHSQSFRSLDFLRHGVPVICNAWLPIARLIHQYEAGWLIEDADEIGPLLTSIMANPEQWQQRRNNTARLVNEALSPERAAAPLLAWLETASKAPRLPDAGKPSTVEPVLGIPPYRERLARRYRLARRILLNHWFRRGDRQAGDAIVVVSRSDLFPTDHGAAVKIIETARGLSRNGREVLLVTDERHRYRRFRDGEMTEHRFPAWLRLLARPLPWVKLDHYTRDIPESNAFLYLPLSDGSFFWRTLFVAGKHAAGGLMAEFPAYAKPCLAVGETLEIPVVMVEHNVEYERLKAQIPELTDDQYRHLKDIELSLCNRCDAVVCVSDNDRQRLVEDGVHAGLLSTIPHGIDLESYQLEAEEIRQRYGIPDDAPVIAYHGTFAYPPNRDALKMLAVEILPRLETRGIEAHVLAIGQRPPDSLHPRIHCPGSVEHMAPWLKAADLAVIPLREGGGTRMKIIDCFAAGLPVVSTSKGIEGIPAIDGHDALVRDDWDAMSDAIVEVLRDESLASRLTGSGRSIAAGLDWTAIGKRYLELFSSLGR